VLTVLNCSAAAHVVTATELIDDGVAGGAKNTITFAPIRESIRRSCDRIMNK
jgi:hypothetical protein